MAESSRDEIAKLESMYAANPEGRVFTHLAEAYRKAGDLPRAREVLEDGLQRHSDSASGYVVLGRVMQDLAQVDEASAAFARVLELDPENRVALRALGELASAAGDTAHALSHFRQLLTLDPSDESVESLINQLRSGGALTSETGSAKAASDSAAASAPAAAAAAPSADAAPASAASTPTPEATAAEPSAPEPLPAAGMTAAAQASPAETAPAGAASPEDGAAALDFSALTGGAPDEMPSDAQDGEPFADLDLPPGDAGWVSDGDVDAAAWPGTGEENAAFPRLEGLESLSGEEEDIGDVPPLPLLERTEPEEAGSLLEAEQSALSADGESEVGEIADWDSARQAEVATETLAELYRAQGHLNRASDVYRALLRDRPGDEELERKLLEVETAIFSSATEAAAAFAEPEAAPEGEPQASAAGMESAAPADIGAPEDLAAPAEAEPWATVGGPAEQEPAGIVSEPWADDAAVQAEPVGPAAESTAVPDEPWTNTGELVADEPTPYAWESAAAEEEAGPPIAAYLRGLIAWRRGSGAEAAYRPGAGGDDQPVGGHAPTAYGQAGEYGDVPDYGVPAPAASEGEHGPGDLAAVEGYDAASGVGERETAEPPDWLDRPADAAPDESRAADEPWAAAAPPEPTWVVEDTQEPWTPEEDSPAAPSGDMDWRPGSDAVKEQASASPTEDAPAEGEASEGPADDDDLEMFRTWLQSLKK